ncbi:PREDICTED: translation initiation factor IF-2-like [Ceratotherium simum simum]|uniref:Translation initiation factor IF-2-like n=1 Tax=Ceratotherium simum simum TaxID=73337 RepID=A0ABM1D2T6_CERSS|nr:PREDICTED: translation initiation factor IF-2-like [Ceratotherium simum simum]
MTGQRAPRPLPLPRPPPRRPRPRLPAPGRESSAGRPDPPKGPEAGAPGSQGPGEGPPAARRPQVQSTDTAPRGEGAPSLSRALPPGRSGPRPSLASDPAPGRGAARGPCTPEGGCGCWKERPVGWRVGRRGRPRSRSGTQVAGAGRLRRNLEFRASFGFSPVTVCVPDPALSPPTVWRAGPWARKVCAPSAEHRAARRGLIPALRFLTRDPTNFRRIRYRYRRHKPSSS